MNPPQPAFTYAIQRADRDDVDAIVGIDHLRFDPPWSHDWYTKEAGRTGSRIYVLRAADCAHVVAFLDAWQVCDEVQLLRMATHPSHSRRGCARALLNRLVLESQNSGATRIYLEVRPSNLAAFALYQQRGFEITGRRARYYDDGEDALVMALDLLDERRRHIS